MNIVLWVLQVLLALHTAIGAIWKFSHSAQTVPSLNAIPHNVWLGLGGVEFLCVIGFLIPALGARYTIFASLAALAIAVEMLAFCGVQLAAGSANHGMLIYWLVVAAICAFVAYGRRVGSAA